MERRRWRLRPPSGPTITAHLLLLLVAGKQRGSDWVLQRHLQEATSSAQPSVLLMAYTAKM
jgi:hypothetical protein